MWKNSLVLISMSHQCCCCHRHLAVRRESKYKQRCRKVKRLLSPSFANSHHHDKQHTLAYLTSKYVPELIFKPPQTPKLSRIIEHFCKVLCVRGDCTCKSQQKPHTSGWHLRSKAIILHGFNLNARMAAKKAKKKTLQHQILSDVMVTAY